MTRFGAWIRKALQSEGRSNHSETLFDRNIFPRVYDTRLEDRRVLSASPVSPAVDLAALALDAGSQANDGQVDRFELSRSGGAASSSQIAISINQRQVWQGEASQLSSIRLQGSADQDVFVIDPTIQILGGVFIDGAGAPADAADQLAFATTSAQAFAQINYQAADDLTRVQFIGNAEGQRSEFQIHSVEVIFDANQAHQRTLENHSSQQDWLLQSVGSGAENRLLASQHLELTSGQNRYTFAAPTERLTLDTQMSTVSSNRVVLHDVRMPATAELSICGDAADSVYQTGMLNVGSSLSMRTGSIQIAGEIRAAAADLTFDADDALWFTSSASLLNSQGSLEGRGATVVHSGVISVGSTGEIRLDAGLMGRLTVDGSLLARGDFQQHGGSIVLVGAEIDLLSRALIDVSGGSGGGQILIGGDYQGANPGVPNAELTRLAAGAVLRADAERVGDGGRIVVWANDTTIIAAAVNISARGGALAGNGGFIETSGKRILKIQASVDASAARGQAGIWLIDPTNVEIVAVIPGTPAADTSYILASDINAALAAGTNVVIQTSAIGSADGDIAVNAAISASPVGSAKLTLIALRDVIFNAGVSSNSNLGVSITATRNVEANSVALDQLNFLTIDAGGAVSLQSLSVGNGSDNTGQAVDIQGDTIVATGLVRSNAGNIRLQANSAAPGITIELQELDSFGGDIEFRAASAVAFLGGGNSVHSSGGNGSLTIRGVALTTSIGLGTGATGSLTLDDNSISAIGAGFENGINFGASGQQGNIAIAGLPHNYDQSLTIKLDGGASLQLLTDLSTTKNSATGKSIQIEGAATSTIHMAANITTAGGNVTLADGLLLVDGAAVRRIVSGGTGPNAAQGGAIDLSGLVAIDGSGGVAELELDSRGTANGGAVLLTTVTATGSGLNRIDIQTSGTVDGQVTLDDVRLIHNATAAPLLQVNQTDATPQTIHVSGLIDLSTNQNGLSGGSVDFGSNLLGPSQPGSSLTILTRNTDTTAGSDGSDGGNISLGGITSAAGEYLDAVVLDSSAADSDDSSGRIIFSGTTTASITVDGGSGGNANLVGIGLIGDVEVALGGSLTLTTHPGVLVGFNSQAIDLRQTRLLTAVSLQLDTSGGGNLPMLAGHVLLGDLGSGVRPTGLIVDTRGGTAGRLIVDDGDAGVSQTVIQVDGNLDLRNTTVELRDATQLVTHGNGHTLTLGSVLTSGGPQDLTLTSDSDIEVVDSLDLAGGNLVARVDANDDQVGSRWRSTGAVEAGSIALHGSGAENDIALIEGGLTTTLGAMQFTNWDQVRLLSDLDSASSVTATNISGVLELGDAADILANGSLELATTVASILLSGTNGSINVLTAQGNNSTVALAAVTATNNNVQLSLLSDYSTSLGTVDIQAGTLLVDFSRNTTNTDATATLSTVQAGELQVRGGSRINDRVNLNGQLTVGMGGLLIEDINQLDINANLNSLGAMQVTGLATSTIHLAADLFTAGGAVTLTGGTLLVDATAVRRIASGGTGPSVAQGGAIDLSGLVAIDGSGGVAELELDSRGTTNGGAVLLTTVTATGSGLNRIDIQTSGTVDGQVTLSDVRLIHNATAAPLLQVNQADATPQTIHVSGLIDLSTNQNGLSGGSVNFGSNLLGPSQPGSSLTISTRNTDTTAGSDGSDGGNISLGGITSAAGEYLDAVVLDSSAADSDDSSGRIIFSGTTTASVTVDGSSGGNADLVGIGLIGDVEVALGGSLTLTTHPGVLVGFNSQAIDLRQTRLLTAVSLQLDTSGGGNLPMLAGHVLLGDLGSGVRPTGLIVDTRGGTAGRLIVDDGDAGVSQTVIQVDGNLDLRNTTVELRDATQLVTHGNGHTLTLGSVLTSGGPQDLTLTSDSDIEVVDSLDLAGGNLVARVDANDDQVGSRWRSTGAVEAGSIALHGSGSANDLALIEGGLTTTLGAMQFTNWDQVRLLSDLDSASSVTATNISGVLELGDAADILANGSLELATTVASILLSGTSGSVNVLTAQGNNSTIALAAVTATNNNVQLSLLSDYSTSLGTVDIQAGTLLVDFSRNTTNTDAAANLSTVQAGELQIRGGSRINDRVNLNGQLTVGTGGLLIEDINQLDINANLSSAGAVTLRDVTDRVQIAQSVVVSSVGNLDMQTGVAAIQLSGAANTTNRLEVSGNSGALRLADIESANGVDLELLSEKDIVLQSVDLSGDGDLIVKLDVSNDTTGAQLTAGALIAASINIQGSATVNDVAVINNAMESRSGSIVFDRFEVIRWQGNVQSATEVLASNVSGRILLGPNTTVQANDGSVRLNSNVSQIEFQGGVGVSNSIIARQGSLQLAALVETNSGGSVILRADQDVDLQSSVLGSSLLVVAGDNGGLLGQIRSAATLAATSLSLNAATGIGGVADLQTATQSLAAANRVSGDIRISNTSPVTVVASNVENHQGGNVILRQAGGGALSVLQIATQPDASPTFSEANIVLTSDQAAIIVDGAGVSAGGEGGISYSTTGAGDIILNAATQAAGNLVSLQSSGAILGSGVIVANTVVLGSTAGIGAPSPVQTQAVSLSAASGLGAINLVNTSSSAANVSSLVTNSGGSIRFVQLGGGALNVHQVQTGPNETGGAANIGLFNNAGSLFVLGGVSAGATGSIEMLSTGDLTLGGSSRVETQGVAATIRATAGGSFQFTPGAIIHAGSFNPATEAVVTELPPQFLAQAVVNSLAVNVDLEGFAQLQILLGSATATFVDRNYGLNIHWGDGQVDRLPGGPIAPDTINPGIPRYDANGLFYQITHQYLTNPSTSDPYANIPVMVAISVDALGRIEISDSSGSANIMGASQSLSLEVPTTGLFSLSFRLPQAASVSLPFTFVRQQSLVETINVIPSVKSLEQTSFSTDSSIKAERRYVLRVITPVDEVGRVRVSEDVPLEEADIVDLHGLFQKLGDNRYRIYLILEDGNELLLRDFYLRNHAPIEIDELQLWGEDDLPVIEESDKTILLEESH